MTLANSLALPLLAAVCSSSTPRLVPLALLLLADRCEAVGTVCDNNVPCSSGCPTGVYGTSLCDGTYRGTEVYLGSKGLSGTIPPQLGDISQLTWLNLFDNSISGTIPPQTSKLSQLTSLWLSINSISGTIPPQTSKLSQLERLFLDSNSISGTIPPETSELLQLNYLYLYSNSISGTIPPEMSKLSQLRQLQLYNNTVSGTVPSQLNDLPLTFCSLGGTNHFACPLPALPNVCTSSSSFPPECNYPPPSPPPSPPSPPLPPLPPSPPPSPPPTRDFCGYAPAICDGTFTDTTLDLSNQDLTGSIPKQLGSFTLTRIELEGNAFEYPSDAATLNGLKAALQRCRGGFATCTGVPPTSCTAFAGFWGVNIKDTSECFNCDSFRESMPVLIAVIAALALVALAALGWFAARILRHPTAMKRWVSTVAIFVNHVQMLSLIGSFHLEWPRSLEIIIETLRLHIIALPSASCLVSTDVVLTMYSTTMIAMASLMLAPLCAEYVAGGFRDNAELVHSVAFAVLLTSSWSVIMDVLSFYIPDPLSRRWHPETLDSHQTVLASLIVLVYVESLLAYRLVQNVISFRRGLDSGEWRSPFVISCAARKPIFPRRLERQVAFLTSRFAGHASSWQLTIWRRQLVIFSLAVASRMSRDHVESATLEAALRYCFASAAIAAILFFWREHELAQPFVYLFQNALESWLFRSNVLLLVLACVYTALPSDRVAHIVLEILLSVVLLGGLVAGAVYAVRQLRRTKEVLAGIDFTEALASADSVIDAKLKERLGDGSIRLVCCSWLQSPEADASLARDGSGAVIMRRRQELPEAAFVPSEEAVAMLERGDRSILVLSYGWLKALHPDPHGTTLAAVRRFLEADAATQAAKRVSPRSLEQNPLVRDVPATSERAEASDIGLFWDFASLPQKGPNGEEKTEEEKSIFGRGLKVMGNFYASVTGTSVIQQRNIDIPPGATTGFGPGEYNPTPYEGDGGRGWCIFEQGVAMTVLAHLTKARQEAEARGSALSDRFQRAESSRAKVYDISGAAAPVARECERRPLDVLDEACAEIAKARFTGKADGDMVPHMLAEFEWTVRNAAFQALEQNPARTGVAVNVQGLLPANAEGRGSLLQRSLARARSLSKRLPGRVSRAMLEMTDVRLSTASASHGRPSSEHAEAAIPDRRRPLLMDQSLYV